MPRTSVVHEFLHRLGDGHRCGGHRADLAGGVPLREDVRRGFPRGEVHPLADLLAGECALDAGGTRATPIAFRCLTTSRAVSAVEPKHETERTRFRSEEPPDCPQLVSAKSASGANAGV